MDCLITIIIPVYNAERFILTCLQSVSLQTFKEFEVLLINDGSTDCTEALIKNYIEKKPNWFLFSKENGGVSQARNLGIRKANGNHIVFIDADDSVDENYLKKLYEPYYNSIVQLTCCGYTEFSKYNNDGTLLHDFHNFNNKIIDKNDFYKKLFTGVTGVLWGKMFVSSIIKENKILLNENIHLSEDLVFVFEYIYYVEKIALVKEHLYYYNRIHESGLSSKLTISNLLDLQLTNDILTKLGSKQTVLNLDEILKKRFVEAIINITRSVSISKNPIEKKIRDLNYILSETKKSLEFHVDFNKDSKIILRLLKKEAFNTLLLYNFLYNTLRKIKNMF